MFGRRIREPRADIGVANGGEMESPGIFTGTGREVFEVTFDRYLYASERLLHASTRAKIEAEGRMSRRIRTEDVDVIFLYATRICSLLNHQPLPPPYE